MSQHILLPGIHLKKGLLSSYYEDYIKQWLDNVIDSSEQGVAASSICTQACMIEIILYGNIKFDWLSVMDDLLLDSDAPLAYSEGYANQLHKFDGQSIQSPIHAIHSRWWIERLLNPQKLDHDFYSNRILRKQTTNGLIYDEDISPTILRHRMKSEIALSMLQSIEILSEAGLLNQEYRRALATDISDIRKLPCLGYMSAEQFRYESLSLLGYTELFPTGLEHHIEMCATDLELGWGDFAIASKVDAYMGTAKRSSRDKPIHSPLIACHVSELNKNVIPSPHKEAIHDKIHDYGEHLKRNPGDIPAFQMRDVPIPFGASLTPIEAICASHLVMEHDEKNDVRRAQQPT